MEGLATSVYRVIWRRRGYQRLNGSGRRTIFTKLELGRRKRLKLSRLVSAPKKLLPCLRHAYVNMMIKLAHSRCFTPGYGGACGDGPRKEYEEKMVVEMYKSLVTGYGFEPRGVGRIGPHLL